MRVAFFIAVLLAGFFLSWWAFLFIAILYTLFYRDTYELLVIAVIIDAMFGPHNSSYFYTIVTGISVVSLQFMKQYFVFYR